MSSAVIQLLVLAGIALFLILRLKNVLGTRDGFEKPPIGDGQKTVPGPVKRDFAVIEGGPDRDISDNTDPDGKAGRALAAMKQTEPDFGVTDFLGGARGAYEMILTAFESGEIEGLRPYLSPDVYESFEAVVKTREAEGLRVDASFIGIREIKLVDADYDTASNEAEITIRFVAELTSVVRDRAGEIIEGNPEEIKRQKDVWTFARIMGSTDPNWLLVATGG